MPVDRRSERWLHGGAAVAAALGVLALASVPAAGASVSCRAPTDHPFPPASGLRSSHASCSTARALVEFIQAEWQLKATLPGWFKAPSRGHRWHCLYTLHQRPSRPYRTVRCSSGPRLVRMTLG
jgi:hypothetical protein